MAQSSKPAFTLEDHQERLAVLKRFGPQFNAKRKDPIDFDILLDPKHADFDQVYATKDTDKEDLR